MTGSAPAPHPLADVLRAAAAGHPPAPNGRVERLPPWREGVEAVVAVSGHAWFCLAGGVPVPDVDAYGGATDPRTVTALAGGGGIDSLDLVLAAGGTGGGDAPHPALVPRPDLSAHPRVAYARARRDDVTVWGRPGAGLVVTRARGLAGLPEVSVELPPGARGRGAGTRLAGAARGLVPAGTVVLALVAPGHVASLRAFLGAGFAPVAAAQLWRPRCPPAGPGPSRGSA